MIRAEAVYELARLSGYTPSALSQMNRHTLYAILCDGHLEKTEAAQVLLARLSAIEYV